MNWPEQAYENGVSKNNVTRRSYKCAVRILKRLRNKMQDDKVIAAQNVASSLIESLIWNAPDEAFEHTTFTADMRHILAHAFNNMRVRDTAYKTWTEVNGLKYLFGDWQPAPGQPWTRATAHAFISAAWDYLGFE